MPSITEKKKVSEPEFSPPPFRTGVLSTDHGSLPARGAPDL
jgi:hypothetical protein